MDLIVLAKAPEPGRVKTRLSPPCTPQQAAALASAALADTLDAALATAPDRIVLALDGEPGSWLPAGVEVVDQGGGTFRERLGRAWTHTTGPALLIGMDTPQLTAAVLTAARDTLLSTGTDAALGLAEDGGWWAIGLRRSNPLVFAGIPTSRPDTGRRQRARLAQLGLRTRPLPQLRDVDNYDDAVAVAALAPETRFARRLAALSADLS